MIVIETIIFFVMHRLFCTPKGFNDVQGAAATRLQNEAWLSVIKHQITAICLHTHHFRRQCVSSVASFSECPTEQERDCLFATSNVKERRYNCEPETSSASGWMLLLCFHRGQHPSWSETGWENSPTNRDWPLRSALVHLSIRELLFQFLWVSAEVPNHSKVPRMSENFHWDFSHNVQAESPSGLGTAGEWLLWFFFKGEEPGDTLGRMQRLRGPGILQILLHPCVSPQLQGRIPSQEMRLPGCVHASERTRWTGICFADPLGLLTSFSRARAFSEAWTAQKGKSGFSGPWTGILLKKSQGSDARLEGPSPGNKKTHVARCLEMPGQIYSSCVLENLVPGSTRVVLVSCSVLKMYICSKY